MRVFRAILFAAMIFATPFPVGAQVGGGQGGLPGGPWTWPPPQPSACQKLLALRDYVQEHRMAIQEANKGKASAKEGCQLFSSFVSGEAAFIRMLEDSSHTCGMPREAIKQAREEYAKASRIRKQLCNAAASRNLGLPDPLWDLVDTNKAGDYNDNCRDCGKTGDFWWPSDRERLPGR